MRRAVGFLRRYPNVAWALLVALACFVIGFATGFWLLFRLAYVILLVIPLVYVWTRSMINDLEVEVHRYTQRISQGQTLDGRIVLTSTSRIPKVWLEVRDAISAIVDTVSFADLAARPGTPAAPRATYAI